MSRDTDYGEVGIVFAALCGLLAIVAIGCFQAAGEPFPTAAQMLTACEAEKAAGTPQSKAPDCLRWWAVTQGCQTQAVMNTVNSVLVPVATAGDPLIGTVINAGATLNTAQCKERGFLK